MQALDTIPLLSEAKKYYVTFEWELFWQFDASSLVLPCKAYVPILMMADKIFNDWMSVEERDLMIEQSWTGWIIEALTGRLSEEDTEKFIESNPFMKSFEIFPDFDYE